MVIDFHTHAFPDKIANKTIEHLSVKGGISPFSDGSLTGLINSLEQAGSDIGVNLPVMTNPSQFDSVNRFAAEINNAFSVNKRGVISFAGIHPACEDIEGKMKLIKEQNFLGVKIHPDYQQTFFDDDGYIRILKCAKELDLIVTTHAGVDGGYRGCPVRCTPERARNVIRKVGHAKLVLAHLGANEMYDEALELLCGEDVYLDTAYVLRFTDKNRFCKMLDKHGAERILFASDSPWSSISDDVKIIKSFSLDKRTEEMILGENAATLLGL